MEELKMALIKCIECNNDVSEFADSCPHCGCPVSMSKRANQNNKIDNSKYSVILSQRGVSPVKTIDKIRKVTGLSLAEGKRIVDNHSFIKINCSIDEANNIKKLIESEGGAVEIILYHPSQENESGLPKAVKCPYCNSTNTTKISTTKRSLSTYMFGLGSSSVGKQWHCNDCKSDF